nr:hypothetical protein [Tanacetum cinerariifolium]
MNQYETDAADMLAVALAETPNDDFNTSCKVLAGVLEKRDEDVHYLVGELNQNKQAWEQAQQILTQM